MRLILHSCPTNHGLASRPHTTLHWLTDRSESLDVYWLFYLAPLMNLPGLVTHFLKFCPSLASTTVHFLVLILPLRLPSPVSFKNTSFPSCHLKFDFLFPPSAFFPWSILSHTNPVPPLPLPQSEETYPGPPHLCLQPGPLFLHSRQPAGDIHLNVPIASPTQHV